MSKKSYQSYNYCCKYSYGLW